MKQNWRATADLLAAASMAGIRNWRVPQCRASSITLWLGTWRLGPDAPFAGSDAGSPQSWQLYTYGLNSPLLYTDPNEHDVTCSGDGRPRPA